LKGREWPATSWGLSEAREAPCLPAGLPLAIERDAVWNVAGGEATTILELATATAAAAGRLIGVRYQRRPSRDVDRLLLCNAALSATGLSSPPLALAEGLLRRCQYGPLVAVLDLRVYNAHAPVRFPSRGPRMYVQSLTHAPLNRRGGQDSYLLLTKGQFGSQNLTITWVDCEPESEQQMHVHETEEQAYVIVRGRGMMKAGTEEQEVRPGTLVFVPPGTPHAIRNTGDETLTFVSAASPPVDIGTLSDYFAYHPRQRR
jgi:mannose-6-phosphate isomerase-like protein (cupin superfamily)